MQPWRRLAAQPLALTTGDVDEDGIPDLLVGYAGHVSIQRGNLDAFAPQSDASFQAIGREQFPAPFLAQSSTLATPVNPDFMAVGHFTASGHNDLVIAAKGGTALVVFAGDGKGNFAAPQTVNLPGGVTGLAAGDFGAYGQFTTVLVGTKGIGKSFSLVAMAGSFQGLAVTGTFPLSAVPSSIDFANFGGTGGDAAFLAGGQIFVLRSSSMQVVPVSLPISARAFALGSFIFDRSGGTQIAVLAADGSVQIAARSEFDPRTYTVEEFSAIRQAKVLHEAPPLGSAGHLPNCVGDCRYVPWRWHSCPWPDSRVFPHASFFQRRRRHHVAQRRQQPDGCDFAPRWAAWRANVCSRTGLDQTVRGLPRQRSACAHQHRRTARSPGDPSGRSCAFNADADS